MTSNPAYLEHGGEQAMPQPYAINEIDMYSFLLRADAAKLAAYVDRYLTAPTGGKLQYRPLAPLAMLGVYSVGNNHSAPPAPNVGSMSTKEICFFVPVALVSKQGAIEVVKEVAWWVPYIIVNDGWAMASGREVYGVPKEMGEITLPDSTTAPDHFSASTLCLKNLGPGEKAQLSELIRITRQSKTGSPLHRAWKGIEHGAESIWHEIAAVSSNVAHGSFDFPVPGFDLLKEIWNLIARDELPMVFLKQFRDIENYQQACYQAIASAKAKITKFRSGGFLKGPFEIKINQFATHPIVDDLGLKGTFDSASESWSSQSIVAMHANFDFTLENGTTRWQSTPTTKTAVPKPHFDQTSNNDSAKI